MFRPHIFILALIPQSDSGGRLLPHSVDQSRAPNSVGRPAFVKKSILLDILGEAGLSSLVLTFGCDHFTQMRCDKEQKRLGAPQTLRCSVFRLLVCSLHCKAELAAVLEK